MRSLMILVLSLFVSQYSVAGMAGESQNSGKTSNRLEVTLNFNSDLKSPFAKAARDITLRDLENLVATGILKNNETKSEALIIQSISQVSIGVFHAEIQGVNSDVTVVRITLNKCSWSGQVNVNPSEVSHVAVAMLPGCPDTQHTFTTNLKPGECKSATFPKYPGTSATDRNSIESSLKGLLAALGMNQQEINDMCEKDVQCWLTTDECRLMGISSSNADGVDHTGGRKTGSYSVCRNGDGTFTFTALCECWPRY